MVFLVSYDKNTLNKELNVWLSQILYLPLYYNH